MAFMMMIFHSYYYLLLTFRVIDCIMSVYKFKKGERFMKNLKKILAAVLCLIMLMGTCSAFAISASAVSGPTFSLEETSNENGKVTMELKLQKGGFNALDFQFVMPAGVTCESITINSQLTGSKNVANGKVSAVYSTDDVTAFSEKTTIVTAVFNVSSAASAKITGRVENCAICSGEDNVDVTSSTVVEGSGQSFFAKLIAAIVSFFQMIINFITGLFA